MPIRLAIGFGIEQQATSHTQACEYPCEEGFFPAEKRARTRKALTSGTPVALFH